MPVSECYRRVSDELIILTVKGQTIETTPEHPFYVQERGWVIAKNLTPGDFLITINGDAAPIGNIEVKKGEFTVYNFRVDVNHTYYITSLELLVHNACGSGPYDGLGGNTELGEGDMAESGLEAGTDTAEAGAEVGAEAGAEAATEVGTEIAVDVGIEAGIDAGAEAGEIVGAALFSLLLL